MRVVVLVLVLVLVACGDRTSGDVDAAPSPRANVDTAAAGSAAGGPADPVARFAASLPDSLRVRHGACPFECCTYREWTAATPIRVYERERASGDPSFTLSPGDTFLADSGNVHITGLQLVVVTDSVADRPYWAFSPGDTLVVLDAQGEGHYNVWDGERVRDVEGFWETWRTPHTGRTLGEYSYEWWVHVTRADGRSGWFHASRETRFRNADACGG